MKIREWLSLAISNQAFRLGTFGLGVSFKIFTARLGLSVRISQMQFQKIKITFNLSLFFSLSISLSLSLAVIEWPVTPICRDGFMAGFLTGSTWQHTYSFFKRNICAVLVLIRWGFIMLHFYTWSIIIPAGGFTRFEKLKANG